MNDHQIVNRPPVLDAILADTQALGFKMSSEPQTGSLLRTLAASKPRGRFLELGTGTGFGTASILSGMDADSRLESVESDAGALAVARRHLAHDRRITLYHEDGETFLQRAQGRLFDFIFADTWPGKFTLLPEALALLAPGGFYIVDDLLPQANWPRDHAPKIPCLVSALERRTDLSVTKLCWASGLIVATRLNHASSLEDRR
jgi:predicted O-methyltransferase YrrM